MKIQALILPAVLAAILAMVVVPWMREYADFEVAPRVPGLDGRPQVAVEDENVGPIEGTLVTFDATPSEIIDTWPAFRGAKIDGVVRYDIPRPVPQAKL
ncbi:MAG: hypothetical protein ACYSUT_10125, partial [Planctomycetota bacterium]